MFQVAVPDVNDEHRGGGWVVSSPQPTAHAAAPSPAATQNHRIDFMNTLPRRARSRRPSIVRGGGCHSKRHLRRLARRAPSRVYSLPMSQFLPADFRLRSSFEPAGDQAQAIGELTEGVLRGDRFQCLLGVTGSGKTFTMANMIARLGRPTLIISHNKTLAAQLYGEFRQFFPENAVGYFVSYYDYFQPEAYLPSTDTYIEKDAASRGPRPPPPLRHQARTSCPGATWSSWPRFPASTAWAVRRRSGRGCSPWPGESAAPAGVGSEPWSRSTTSGTTSPSNAGTSGSGATWWRSVSPMKRPRSGWSSPTTKSSRSRWWIRSREGAPPARASGGLSGQALPHAPGSSVRASCGTSGRSLAERLAF